VKLSFPKVATSSGVELAFWGGVPLFFVESVNVAKVEAVNPMTIRCSKASAATIIARLNDQLASVA